MADSPDTAQGASPAAAGGAPPAEELRPRSEDGSSGVAAAMTGTAQPAGGAAGAKRPLRRTYRPSHRATFIALTAILVLLAINAGIIAFVIQRQQQSTGQNGLASVQLSPSVLSQLGVNRTATGAAAEQLTVNPNAKFNGNVSVANNFSVGGTLTLNSKVSAPDASLAQLEAGKTSLASADINGAATATDLSLRNGLQVAGATHLQGPVTISQLLTVANSLNVSGNLTVGGTISTGGFSARSLTSSSTLTIGGHVITAGLVPGSGSGPAVGPAGTTSVSGNDSSGTIAINTGGSPGPGILVNIAFRTQYGSTPHVVISPVGGASASLQYYVNRSVGGFSIGASNAPAPGTGYVFDYIVEQ